jgi:hypothetical protein
MTQPETVRYTAKAQTESLRSNQVKTASAPQR